LAKNIFLIQDQEISVTSGVWLYFSLLGRLGLYHSYMHFFAEDANRKVISLKKCCFGIYWMTSLLENSTCVYFVDCCLSFCPFSYGDCVFCPLIYKFWLPLWILQALLTIVHVMKYVKTYSYYIPSDKANNYRSLHKYSSIR
jgi:hypothetical protein